MKYCIIKTIGILISGIICFALVIYFTLGLEGLMYYGFQGYSAYYLMTNEVKHRRSVEFDAMVTLISDMEEGMSDYEASNDWKTIRDENDFFMQLLFSSSLYGPNDVCPRVPPNISEFVDVSIDNQEDPLRFLTVAWPGVREDHAILYFHGGGYVGGDPRYPLSFLSRLSRLTDSVIYALDYKKAPEHPLPAAFEESARAYTWIATKFSPEKISVGGDSSGGGLVFGALQRILKNEKMKNQMPASVFGLSPNVDLSVSFSEDKYGEIKTVAKYVVDPEDEWDMKDWRISPIFGEFEGLPKTLVSYSKEEVMEGEVLELLKRMKESGVDVEVMSPNVKLIHVWLVMCSTEGIEDTAVLSYWIRKQWEVK